MMKKTGLKLGDSEQQFIFNGGHGPPFMPPAAQANSGRQTPNGKYEQIQRLDPQPKNVQGSISQIDILRKQNEHLHSELASKSEEVEKLSAQLRQLTEPLNDLPDISAGNYADDRSIHLMATNEMANGGYWTETREEGEDDMTKSIQCSEQSIERPCGNEYNGEVNGRFVEGQVPQVRERSISSASSTSFEIVGHVSCADPATRLEEGELKKLENEKSAGLEQMNLKGEVHFLKSKIKTLEAGLKSRDEVVARISKRLDERDANVLLGARSRTAAHSEFRPLGVSSQGCSCPEAQDLKQTVSELTAAKWKLTEQAKEWTKEHEKLTCTIQELRSRAAVDVQKFEEEKARLSRQVTNMENQLQDKHQCLLEAGARIRELENQSTGDFVIQQGTDETTIQLTTENALLKHQIETYQEDFEVERRDREKLLSERDTVQRHYETLHSDLGNARKQLRKYEEDIGSLRADNSTMRARLREVTEQLPGLEDSEILPLNTTRDFSKKSKPASQPQNVVNPKSSSTLPGPPSADWKCRACTFSNPAVRTSCEMCGTLNDPKPSTSSRVPTGTYAQDISTNASTQSTPLLSNLRNYGDIETD